MASGRQRHLVTLHLHALHHKLVATAGVSVEACRLGLPHTGASTLPPAAHRYCMATSPGRRWPVQGSAAGSSYAWRTGRPGMQARTSLSLSKWYIPLWPLARPSYSLHQLATLLLDAQYGSVTGTSICQLASMHALLAPPGPAVLHIGSSLCCRSMLAAGVASCGSAPCP